VSAASPLCWRGERELVFPGVTFDLDWTPEVAARSSTAERFVVVKSREMIEFYARHFAGAQRVLEVGIFKGGSVALFHRLFRPTKLVAIELSSEPVAALAEYVARHGVSDVIRPYYGVDQADGARLQDIVCDEFGSEGIDLVVDDGCHLLPETRATFNALFPFVRARGAYIIEDWAWAHWPGMWQDRGGPWPEHPATTQLIFELVMLSASHPELAESVEARADLALVRRGNAAVARDFDLSSSYRTAGRQFGEYRFTGQRVGLLQRATQILRQAGVAGLLLRAARKTRRLLAP
jgi:hypothetical protein